MDGAYRNQGRKYKCRGAQHTAPRDKVQVSSSIHSCIALRRKVQLEIIGDQPENIGSVELGRHDARPRGRRRDACEGDVDQDFVIVLTTVAVDVNAGVIAEALVEDRLAACVNVLPEMTSYFRWQGAVEQAEERQLLIKTTAAQLPALEQRLHELHPYELPEFLVLPIRHASAAYAKWVVASTGLAEPSEDVKH